MQLVHRLVDGTEAAGLFGDAVAAVERFPGDLVEGLVGAAKPLETADQGAGVVGADSLGIQKICDKGAGVGKVGGDELGGLEGRIEQIVRAHLTVERVLFDHAVILVWHGVLLSGLVG